MRALILAGGYGTRLGELTKSLPKALVEVGGVPIIDRTIKKLTEIGITEITINTHYLHEMVKDHLNKRWEDLKLRIVFEPELLGTAGTLKNNIEWLAVDDFVVMHGDNFFTDNLDKLTANPLKSENLLRACTFYSENPQECGIFTLSPEGKILRFDEKDQNVQTNLANAAIYRFSKDVTRFILDLSEIQTDISLDIIPAVVNRMELILLEGDFIDIGTIEGLNKANLAALTTKYS